jgi:hypothetical protein
MGRQRTGRATLTKASGTATRLRGTGAAATVVLALAVTLTGCTGTNPAGPAKHTTTTEASSSTSPTAVPPPTTTTTVPAQPGWTPVSTVATGVAIDERAITTARRAAVTLIRFRAGQVVFALHPGSQDPPHAAASLGATVPPTITTGEKPALLGAFNGGFKVSGHAGGVEILGHVLTPLVVGMASLVIDTDGSAHIGAWGTTVPGPGEAVASVRQNLPPLVSGGQPSPSISSASAWGDPLHENPVTARSALGQDAAGNLIYAASLHALPLDMAGALLDAGVTVAMELDINPEWVQADVAASPGAALAAMVPGQNQSADRYVLGWTRDFVTVDVAPAALRPG